MPLYLLTLLLSLTLMGKSSALRPPPTVSRRSAVFAPAVAGALSTLPIPPQPQHHQPAAAAAVASATTDLLFSTSASGIQWADAKVGSGAPKRRGESVAIDYVMSTTGARYGSRIYGTAGTGAPYQWVLGDGTTIRGLEEAVLGSAAAAASGSGDGDGGGGGGGGGMPPMMPGGVRRIIVPSELAYASLARPIAGLQMEDCREGRGPGPIPPTRDAFEEFQRFKNIYCNANRPYQPDLVMDIKMYGKRTPTAASQ